MPFSDDLYSPDVNYSDGESVHDELSPADGFFERDNPLHSMVPDPSQSSDDKTVEDKVLISRPEPRTGSGSSSEPANSPTLEQLLPAHNNASAMSSAYGTSSPTASSPPAPRSLNRVHPDALIMGGLPPPPAYSPSPASPTPQELPSPRSSRDSRSYNTFGDRPLDRRLEEGILPRREPETMGRPEEEPNEATPLAGVQLKRKSARRSIITKILFLALIIAVLSSVLTALLKREDSDSDKDPDKDPDKEKDRDLMPSPKLPGGGRRYCASATHHKDPITYYFPLDGDVSVVQKTRDHDYSGRHTQVETRGEIRVRRFPKDSAEKKGHATAVINVSHHEIEVEWTLENDSRALTIITPRFADVDSSIHHCVSLDITVWVPEDAKLSSLIVDAVTLGLTVIDDIQLDVNEAKFRSLSGHISFPTPSSADTPNMPISHPAFRFDSRRIEVQTISGDINGLFPLLDYLEIGSKSGNVDVSILPHDALASAPSPATLNIHTTSGDIDGRLPILSTRKPKFAPPPRDYISTVSSASGDISGTYYLGSSTIFETISGQMKVRVLPVLQYGDNPDKDPKATFSTQTISGDTELEILDPMFISPITLEHPTQQYPSAPYRPIGDEDPYRLMPGRGQSFSYVGTRRSAEKKLHSLRSSHNSTSGEISIRNPSAWEGTVSGHTLSGDITLEGKGLDIIRNKKGYISREFLARKGVDSGDIGSITTIESISGDILFRTESN